MGIMYHNILGFVLGSFQIRMNLAGGIAHGPRKKGLSQNENEEK